MPVCYVDPWHAPGTEMEGRLKIAAPTTCPADLICLFSTGSVIEVRSNFPLYELHLHPFAFCLVGPCWCFSSQRHSDWTKFHFTFCMSQRKRVTWLHPMQQTQLWTRRRVMVASWMENLIPYLKCSMQCRVVITLISSSVHGCLWSFQGRAERDRNHGSAMDDYLATPDQRFPSISSEDKEKSISSTLWKYLCLLHSTVVQQGLGLSQPASNRGSRISAHACQDAREAPQTAALRGN